MSDSLTGQEVNGYRIGPLLGAGGMGEVYQAMSLTDNVVVAMKFLRQEAFTDAKMQGRFAREVRIMQDMDHPNIMPIYSSGVWGNNMYYTMHLVNGQTMATFIRRRKLSPLEFYPILEQLVAALSYGHSVNLVHRDVKPDNVFIERNRETNRPHIYLGDFGLGKREGIDQTLTEADSVLGTPHYMAPEAVLGDPLTYRADLYALGVMIYEVLVGHVPFSEEQGHLTAMSHVTKAVTLPSDTRPGFPIPMENMLLRALQKRPDDRYGSANEMLQAYIAAMNAMTPQERTTVWSTVQA